MSEDVADAAKERGPWRFCLILALVAGAVIYHTISKFEKPKSLASAGSEFAGSPPGLSNGGEPGGPPKVAGGGAVTPTETFGEPETDKPDSPGPTQKPEPPKPLQAGAADPKAEIMDLPGLLEAVHIGERGYEMGNLRRALGPINRVIGHHLAGGKVPKEVFIGEWYYRKGMCHRSKGEWELALDSFRTCHKKFPNQDIAVFSALNRMCNASLLRMAEANQQLGRYQDAWDCYTSFRKLKLDPDGNQVEYDDYYILAKRAECAARLKKFDEAEAILIDLAQHSPALRHPYPRIFTESMLVFLGELIGSKRGADASKEEERAVAFIKAHGERFRLSLWGMLEIRMGDQLEALSGKAKENGLDKLAGVLNEMVDERKELVAKLEKRIMAGEYPIEIGAEGAAWELIAGNPKRYPLGFLTRLGRRHEENGSFDIAIRVYQAGLAKITEEVFMAKPNPRSPSVEITVEEREALGTILASMARCHFAIGNVEEAMHYAKNMFERNSFHVEAEDVATMILGELFFVRKNYKACLRATRDLESNLPAVKEVVEFFAAGSQFYLGELEKADDRLHSFQAEFPSSRWSEHVDYFIAANAIQLGLIDEGKELLKDYRENYPDSVYGPSVQAFQASIIAAEGDPERAMGMAKEITANRSGVVPSNEADLLLLELELKGEKRDPFEVVPEVQKMIERARELNDVYLEKKATVLLAEAYQVAGGMDDKLIELSDGFRARYRDDPMSVRLGALVSPSLVALGREKEALKNLRDMLEQFTRYQRVGTDEFSRYLNAYARLHLQSSDDPAGLAGELLFIVQRAGARERVQGEMLIGLIGLMRSDYYDADAATRKWSIDNALKLLADLRPGNLDPETAISAAELLSEFGYVEAATKFYKDLTSREENSLSNESVLKLIDELSEGGEVGKQSAIGLTDKLLEKLIFGEESGKIELKKIDAVAKIKADLLFDLGRHAEAAKVYGDITSPAVRSRELMFRLGKSREGIQDWNGAVVAYTQLSEMDELDGNARAMKIEAGVRASEIMSDRLAKREEAYRGLQKLLAQEYKASFGKGSEDLNRQLDRALKLYRKWQGELGIEPDTDEESGWGLPPR